MQQKAPRTSHDKGSYMVGTLELRGTSYLKIMDSVLLVFI
jgi:hypothetical protein